VYFIISEAYRKSFEAYVVPKMKELHQINVAASTFLSAEALARAIAQRANPTISLFTVDQGPWLQGKDLGLWSKLPADSLPNMADIYPNYRDPDGMGSGLFAFMLGLLYDEGALANARITTPQSLFDLWNPAYAGRIVLPQFASTFAFATLAEVGRQLGEDGSGSYDKAFAKLKELKPNITTFVGPVSQYMQLFQQKEIWATFGAHFTALQAKAAGLPIAWSVPKEGAVAISHFLAIPNNAPNMEEALKLANVMLSPEYQAALTATERMVPVNSKVEPDPSLTSQLKITKDDVANAAQVPWAAYQKNRVALGERWQREIQL
jgi:putative spermidine/putrescine transport system substrate-binding protein